MASWQTQRRLWKGISAALLYGTVSSLMTFCNKALSSTYDFGYPLFLLWVQMLVTQLGLIALHRMGLFVYPHVSIRSLVHHIPVASFYVLNASLAITSLQGMSIPTYGVLKRAGPLFILVINVLSAHSSAKSKSSKEGNGGENGRDVELGGNRQQQQQQQQKQEEGSMTPNQPSDSPGDVPSGVVAAVVIIVLGALIASSTDLHLSSSTLKMALASNLTQALYVTMVETKHQKVSSGGFNYGKKTDPTLGLLAHNSLIAIPLLTLVIYTAGHMDSGASWGFLDQKRTDVTLLSIFTLATALGCSLNYTMFLCIRVNSALTTSLVGHTKTAVQTIVGFFVLAQDVKATYAYVAGVTITSLGGLLFTLAKYHHSERLSGNLPSSFWAWCATWVGVSVSRGRNTLLKASKL